MFQARVWMHLFTHAIAVCSHEWKKFQRLDLYGNEGLQYEPCQRRVQITSLSSLNCNMKSVTPCFIHNIYTMTSDLYVQEAGDTTVSYL